MRLRFPCSATMVALCCVASCGSQGDAGPTGNGEGTAAPTSGATDDGLGSDEDDGGADLPEDSTADDTSGLPTGDGDPDDSDAGDEGQAGSDGPTNPDAPTIVSLSTSATEITTGDTLVVSALVTDPDGIDDLIGGQLRHADGRGTYGTFATAAQEGAYELSIPFATIADATALAGATPTTTQLIAEFFDQAGNLTQDSVSVDLVCASGLACGNDHQCMADDNACTPLIADSCPAGVQCRYNDSFHHFECTGPIGAGEQGSMCQSLADCAAGYACRFEVCVQWCDLDAPTCAAGSVCTPAPSGQGEVCGNEGYCQ